MLRRNTLLLLLSAAILCAAITGCGSGGDSPVSPNTTQERIVESGGSGHVLWGMYNVAIDPTTLEVNIVPLRGAMFTANVTQFMQPPASPIHMITMVIGPGTDPGSGYFVVDVSLRHPFPGLNMYNGFDVRGIFMSDGSVNLDHDSSVFYADAGDSMLMNPDGQTRWWNWEEFDPFNTIFGATQGKLAPPYHPDSTVNAYKYFADSLNTEDPITDLDHSTRGAFTSFSNNTRRYEIQFKIDGTSTVFDFNYAVDASWSEPDPAFAPDYPPEAFPLSANCAEAYLITVTDAGSNAWYVDATDNGGSLLLDIEIFDWQGSVNPSGVPGEVAGLWLEGEVVASPVDLLAGAVISEGGDTSSVFQVEISSLTLGHSGLNNIWIICENADPNTYEPNIDGFDASLWNWPDSPLAAYLKTTVDIAGIQPEYAPEVTAIDPDEGNQNSIVPVTITGNHFADGCSVELRESAGAMVIEADNEVWTDETEVLCDFDLTGANLGLYDVCVINPSTLEGCLDEGFEVLQADIIYVDDSNTTGVEDGSMANPYNTIQEGLTAASAGYEVWVDDSGVDYTGPVTLVADVDLKSVNWDDSDGDDEATISIASTASCVLGANNATLEGFEIDAVRCGIECNGTSPDIIDCRVVDIYENSARAIWLRNNSRAHLDGVEVFDVTNSYYYGYATFYGILIENCDAVGDDNVLIEHTTIHKVYSHGLNGGGYCYPHGLYITGSDGVVVKNTIVHDVTGGNYHYTYGVRVNASADVELVNNVIYDIDKTYYYGTVYGLHFTNCTNLDARNLIISHVHKGEGGTGGYYQTAYGVYQSGSTYSFEYNDVYDCQNGNYVNVTPGIGCISANPQYQNPGTDFHFASGSPCIDAGDPDSAYDDTDGSRNDMGAYGGPGGDW